MIKVVNRETGVEYKAERIEGGFQIFGEDGEPIKKLKESTFKRRWKITGETTSKDEKPNKAEKIEKKSEKKAEPKSEPISPEKREKLIEKIKKILNLAEKNPSMEEGLAAALQAQKLMVKYNIHKEDVELEEIKDEITSIFTQQKHNSHLLAWRKSLAVIVAKNFRCKTYLKGKDVVFRGYKNDAEIALRVYLFLYTIGNKNGSKEYHEAIKKQGTGKGIYNSYVTGFLTGVEEGLNAQCTALMVITPKEVEEEFKAFSANFKKGKAARLGISDIEVFHKGKVEGKEAVKSRKISKKGDK